jgi:hypothetical protein
VKYTLIPGLRAATENRIVPPMQYESSFRELFDWMLDHVEYVERKEEGSFIIPSTFIFEDYIPARIIQTDGHERILYDDDGHTYVGRYAANVNCMTLLPVDIDGGMRIEEARERWKDYQYIIYSSFNHLADGKTHKFRMLFEYRQPIKNPAYFSRRKHILSWLGGEALVDQTCLSRARGFYLPTFGKHNSKHIVLEINHGVTSRANSGRQSRPMLG